MRAIDLFDCFFARMQNLVNKMRKMLAVTGYPFEKCWLALKVLAGTQSVNSLHGTFAMKLLSQERDI